jgi:hypothetical protein
VRVRWRGGIQFEFQMVEEVAATHRSGAFAVVLIAASSVFVAVLCCVTAKSSEFAETGKNSVALKVNDEGGAG